jgi:hypothetical protein
MPHKLLTGVRDTQPLQSQGLPRTREVNHWLLAERSFPALRTRELRGTRCLISKPRFCGRPSKIISILLDELAAAKIGFHIMPEPNSTINCPIGPTDVTDEV